ncbi:MAG: hypothetical protein ACYCPX_06260 [Acidiferrobacteraceae bacterium]
MNKALLIKFRDTDTPFGVRRETLKEIAEKLGVTETKAVHIAIGRLYASLTGGDGDFDFPSDQVLKRIDISDKNLGPVVSRRDISDYFDRPRPAARKRAAPRK